MQTKKLQRKYHWALWTFTILTFFGAILLLNPSSLRADVNPDGSFSYSIPIKIPPGTQGVQPNLALVYNSRSGNGMVGVGWGLAGLPVITRMSYGNGINYDGNDTYVGPGGRLVHVSGNYYRTAQESWNRFEKKGTCGNDPCRWIMKTRDGKTLYFGGLDSATDDSSRIKAYGHVEIRVWALNKYEDEHGNYYEVTYQKSNEYPSFYGDFYPTIITYTKGNDASKFHTITFGYGENPSDPPEIRSDYGRMYNQSAKVEMRHRLRWITVESDGQLIRRYELIYKQGEITGRSQLKSVQEYGSDGSDFPTKIEFDWQDGEIVFSETINGPTDTASTQRVGDFDGDGKTDLLELNWKKGYVYLANGNGFSAPPTGNWRDGFDVLYPTGSFSYQVGDFNGDGKSDLLEINFGNNEANVYLSTGDGFSDKGEPWASGGFETSYITYVGKRVICSNF